MTAPRHQQILDTAASLFAERGFHGVSVHDIGSACGISGPALYKHFASKGDILTQSLTAISERLLAEGRVRADAASDSEAALDALIGWHIDFALGNPALIIIQEREWANLNSAGLQNDITINEVSRAEYRIDGGTAASFGAASAASTRRRLAPVSRRPSDCSTPRRTAPASANRRCGPGSREWRGRHCCHKACAKASLPDCNRIAPNQS